MHIVKCGFTGHFHIIGIDPGNIQSAISVFEGTNNLIQETFIDQNDNILGWILNESYKLKPCAFAIEKIASYGMPVGETVFETVYWSGRFHQLIREEQRHADIYRITRNKVKNHICHSSRAKDSNIRQALIDRFGAPGTKKTPGKTYGIKKDMWAALAVAVTCFDLMINDSKDTHNYIINNT